MIPFRRIVLALFLSACLAALAEARSYPIPLQFVVVTMFEAGAETGLQPGGLRSWVEPDPLAAGDHAVGSNHAGEMAVLTGQLCTLNETLAA
jgi:hypothetical protein